MLMVSMVVLVMMLAVVVLLVVVLIVGSDCDNAMMSLCMSH